eukprot:jgi/Orpsp1_1/1184823/evm.model.c7180000091136.1
MREHLAIVNPNSDNLNRLFNDVITIENLTKRNSISELYFRNQSQTRTNNNIQYNDPMEVDLFKIKNGRRDV